MVPDSPGAFASPGPPGPPAEPARPGGLRGDVARQFWLAHIRIGFAVFLAEAVVVLAYLLATPHGPHRPPLEGLAVAWSVVGVANLALAPWVSGHAWRATFSAAWTIASALAVVGVADLDGGLRSPLVVMLFLPISFASWAFTPVAAAACGLGSLASLGLVVASTGGSSRSAQDALLLGAGLVGSTVLAVASARNRSRREQREAELLAQIAVLAATDGLTGCAVGRVFRRRLSEEVERSARHGHPLSLLMIDVDRFKAVNDTYGHPVGDHVLAGVGAGLRFHSRAADVVARLGGDEFAVLAPDTAAPAAAALAARIRAEIPPGLDVPVTLSVGVAGLDLSSPSAEQLLEDADLALYDVKRNGRDALAVRGRPLVAAGVTTASSAPTGSSPGGN